MVFVSNQLDNFHSSVVDPPDAPVNFTVIKKNTCQVFFTWQIAVPGSSTTAATDSVGLEEREGVSSQWEDLVHDLVNRSDIIALRPEVMYTFRAYSWNDPIGRGRETMERQFDTMTGEH